MVPEILYPVIVVLLGWAVFIYNNLVVDRNRVLTGWSDIDVQLKRRHDLIPKLVEAVKQYADYESAALQTITELRTRTDNAHRVAEISAVETQLGTDIRKLVALAEAYPELQASRSFLDLQASLTDTENRIQHARRYYNGAVRNLNIRVDSFPDMLIARLFGFVPAQYFEFYERQG